MVRKPSEIFAESLIAGDWLPDTLHASMALSSRLKTTLLRSAISIELCYGRQSFFLPGLPVTDCCGNRDENAPFQKTDLNF